MDLRNGRVTVGGLMQNARVRALLMQEFPILRDANVRRRVYGMPLYRILQMGRRFVPQSRIDGLLRQVRDMK